MDLRFFALQRSGHHAIINWIFQQLDGNVLFINHPIGKFALDFYEKSKIAWQPDYFIYNSEDRKLTEALKIFQSVKKTYNFSDHILNILVLRDPYNTLASRIKMRQGRWSPRNSDKDFINLWKEYAKEYLGVTSILKNLVIINYNQWFLSKEYRDKIAESIGFFSSDEGLNSVPGFGDGSSFDHQNYDNKAQDMKVLTRYKSYINNNDYNKLFDLETKDLSHTIFNIPPKIKVL